MTGAPGDRSWGKPSAHVRPENTAAGSSSSTANNAAPTTTMVSTGSNTAATAEFAAIGRDLMMLSMN